MRYLGLHKKYARRNLKHTRDSYNETGFANSTLSQRCAREKNHFLRASGTGELTSGESRGDAPAEARSFGPYLAREMKQHRFRDGHQDQTFRVP
ncbi:unnamed protein product, partial [Iphiclides podalirius]